MGHKCRRSELSVLLTQEDYVGDEEFEAEEPVGNEELGHEKADHPEISLNYVVGITSPKTFKLRGDVNGKEVITMVDPGATHNFISSIVVEALGWNATPRNHME